MARHRRGFLKASPLGPDCAKAKVSRDDFFVGDDSFDVCWGLEDPGRDGGPCPECSDCRAFHLNLPPEPGGREAHVVASRALARGKVRAIWRAGLCSSAAGRHSAAFDE